MSKWRVGFGVGVLLLGLAVVARAIDITACGQTVPSGETGVQQADLSFCGTGVWLGENATLEMNGHVISDGQFGVRSGARRFHIVGPGEITRTEYGVSQVADRLRVSTIDGLNIHDNEDWGIQLGGNLALTNSTVNANGFGEPPGQSYGVSANAVRATNVTVTGNAGVGVFSYRAPKFTNSAITGNNGFDLGIDVWCPHRPRLIGTTCGKSAGRHEATTGPPGDPWDVCAND